jgi:SPX domain protein involved in polyphosphate accumulation
VRPDAAPLPVLERYELKYTIAPELIGPISAYVEGFCSLDKHSELSHDKFYQVNSLYLDTPEYLFLRNRREKLPDRFNMRVRSYGPVPVAPYFLEVKRKSGDIIRKHRARIRDEDLRRVLDIGQDLKPCLVSAGEAENAELFRRLVHKYNAAPVVMTSYRRKAYFSTCDDYARVTFDIGLKYMLQRDYKPLCLDGGLAPSDVETRYDEGTSVILELKCYAKFVPLWMVDLIRAFDLRRRGFSKFSSGMAQVFRNYAHEDGLRASRLVGFGSED